MRGYPETASLYIPRPLYFESIVADYSPENTVLQKSKFENQLRATHVRQFWRFFRMFTEGIAHQTQKSSGADVQRSHRKIEKFI